MTYIIYKRTECTNCGGKGWLGAYHEDTPENVVKLPCGKCEHQGYTDEVVDLLDVLKKISWGETIQPDIQRLRTFENLRIEE